MSFVYAKYIPLVSLAIVIIVIINIRFEIKLARWVKKYWFFRRSKLGKMAVMFHLLGMVLLVVSLLDLKGPPQKDLIEIPDQRTIILIDTSASMLAEDVKPSRFHKALLVARHFAKNSLGHQISIVLFSDVQKQITPFTNDIDFIDSKLAALEKLNIGSGGSNISQALMESANYFDKDASGKVTHGNVLVLTDGEESSDGIKLLLDDTISVAIIGVGTNHGAPIPIRTSRGKFRKYKKFKGNRIISRMKEEYIKNLTKKIPIAKYWVVLSYSIPTAEIITFFSKKYSDKLKKTAITVRESYTRYLAALGVLFMAAGFVSKLSRGFIYSIILVFNLNTAQPSESEKIFNDLKKGGVARDRKLKLAEYYLREKEIEKSVAVFVENVKNVEDESNAVLVNMGTVLLKAGSIKDGLDKYEIVLQRIGDSIAPSDIELLEKIRENTYIVFNQKKKKSSGKSEKEKGKKKKKKNKREQKETEEKKEKQKDKKKKKRKENKKKPKPQPQTLKSKEEQIRKQRKMVKVPKVLNQLMKVDRNIQKKRVKTSRRNRGNTQKDW